MCIAILNTKGTTLKKKLLNNCWENNGDGAGFLYIDDDGKLQTFKTLDSFDEFYNKYIEVKQAYGKRRNILIHFRISTHGIINEDNCHPFIVDENVGFIHNGMMSNVPDSVQYSDTNMLNRTLLKKLKVGFEQDDESLDFLMALIGNGNKLVFLNKNNEWSIVNEAAGHWSLGCWFSNDSYKAVNDWYDFGGVKKKKGSVGFAPSYSYNNYYTEDNGYGTCTPCNGCEMELIGMKEIERGTCEYCVLDGVEEGSKRKDNLGLATCDCCNWHDAEYVSKWNANVCEECLEALDGPVAIESLGA